MKKTQILSAIALAFALGVVAPIAVAENASAVTADVKDAAETDIQKAKDSFGTVTLKSGEKVNGWNRYAQADSEINNAKKVVTDAEDATSDTTDSAAETLMKGVDAAVAAATGITLSQEVQDKMNSTEWTAGTLAEVTEIAKAVRAEYNNKPATSIEKDQATTAVAAIDEAIADAQEVLDNAVVAAQGTEVTALANELQALTGEEVKPADVKTVAGLNSLITKVEAALPQMNRYRAVWTAQNNLQVALDADKTDDEIAKLVAALNAAVAGTGNGTTVPGTDADVAAPATGIAGTAEGTATTVSIVAGLATALTALGAGVVAYRSARRK